MSDIVGPTRDASVPRFNVAPLVDAASHQPRASFSAERRDRMSQEDIDKMIADALGAAAEPRTSGVAHGRHILEQYVALCRQGESPEADPSAEIALPIAREGGASTPARTNPLLSLVRRSLARLKRCTSRPPADGNER